MLDASNLITRGYRNNDQGPRGLSGDRRVSTTAEVLHAERLTRGRSGGEDFDDAGAEILKRNECGSSATGCSD